MRTVESKVGADRGVAQYRRQDSAFDVSDAQCKVRLDRCGYQGIIPFDRVMDEMEEQISSTVPEGGKVTLAEGAEAYPELREAFPMTPKELILTMSGELEANLKGMLEALHNNKIRIVA